MNANDVQAIKEIRNRSTITLNEARDRYVIFRDILSLSSGTFATLTGYREYADLDMIREDFITFARIVIPHRRYSTWMDIWSDFDFRKG